MFKLNKKIIIVSVIGTLLLVGFWAGFAGQNSVEPELNILNPHSSPQVGENWQVNFQTKGTADLTITPDDQKSIDDLSFISLKCGEEERIPNILENDVIFYPNWQCEDEGQAIHLVNVVGKHTLKFQFGGQIRYAYNSPYSTTDTFNDKSKITSRGHLNVASGQVKLLTGGARTTIYVVPQDHTGNFGGRSGADNYCANNKPSNLPAGCTNIHAFISSSSTDEIRDMPDNYGYSSSSPIYWWHNSFLAYEKLANNWNDMLDGSIEISQSDGTGLGQSVWTGSTRPNGALAENCDGWACGTWEGKLGANGTAGSDQYWLNAGANNCGNAVLGIRCVGKCEETSAGYYATGTLVSTNLLSEVSGIITIGSIDSFFASTTKPTGTSMWVQFATSSTSGPWYNNSGVLNGTTSISNGTSSTNLTGLSWSGTNFYYKMQFNSNPAQDATPVLDEITVYYTGSPTVTTQAADNITQTGATLHGSITATGGQNADLRGFDWEIGLASPTGHYDSANVWNNETNAYDDNMGSYTYTTPPAAWTWSEFLELTHSRISCSKVRYYVFASAFSVTIDVDVYYEGGWHDVYQGGVSREVWYENNIPEGTKLVSKARVRFQVPGAPNAGLYEFDFGSDYQDSWTEGTLGNYQYGTGAFEHTISGLTCGTRYYFKAKAHNSNGWGYGADTTLFTNSCITPTVTNSTGVSNLTSNSARLSGEVTSTGGENPYAYIIYWGDDDAGTTTSSWDHEVKLDIEGAQTFYIDLFDLTPNTDYYYRCYAFNSAGEDWADETLVFTPGLIYGVELNSSTREFEDWAWGGDDTLKEAVVGWISFNCKNQNVCATSDYKVMTSFSINRPPTAVNLSVTPPDSTYCGITDYPPVRLNWEFSDPGDSQSAYQIQVATSSNFSSLVLDTEIPGLAGQSKTFVIQPPYPTLSWNRTYYWRLKVWDSQGTPSTDWIVYQDNTPPPESFTTASHSYPSPNFTPSPQNPTVNEVVTFIDNSTCYLTGGGQDYCTTSAATQYQWDFQNVGITDSTYKGNATTTYSTTNPYTVKLTITDELGQTCDTTRGVNVSLPLPEWKEISPF